MRPVFAPAGPPALPEGDRPIRRLVPVSLASGLLALALAACQPASDNTKDIVPPDDDLAAVTQPPAQPAPHARDAGEEGHRGEAHEHGRATLAAALDGDTLSFSFEAPLASIVGFEHEPQTEEEFAATDAMNKAFIETGNMVSINRSAGCLPVMMQSGTHITGDHGSLDVEQVYSCEAPDRIERIEFLLMGDYPALQAIDAIFLSGTQQVAGEMTPSNPVLDIH